MIWMAEMGEMEEMEVATGTEGITVTEKLTVMEEITKTVATLKTTEITETGTKTKLNLLGQRGHHGQNAVKLATPDENNVSGTARLQTGKCLARAKQTNCPPATTNPVLQFDSSKCKFFILFFNKDRLNFSLQLLVFPKTTANKANPTKNVFQFVM